MTYTSPTVTALGSVLDLTLANSGLNKVGNNPDIYSAVVPIIGSIVPSP